MSGASRRRVARAPRSSAIVGPVTVSQSNDISTVPQKQKRLFNRVAEEALILLGFRTASIDAGPPPLQLAVRYHHQ